MDVEHLLADMNINAPAARRSLADHMDSGDLKYRTRSGHTCEMTKEEIELLCKVCTEQEKMLLKLPLIVTTDTSFSEGVWKVDGRTEVSVVSKLLNRSHVRDDVIHLYHPHLRELRKMLPNSVTVLFVP